jgi:2-dehydropantoate 2-reductase
VRPLRHAILGAGGVGLFVAGALARVGRDVVVLVRRPTPRRVRIESAVLGTFEVELATAERLDAEADVVWVATRAEQVGDAVAQPPPARVVLPLSNGVEHVAVLRKAYGERVLPALIRVEARREAPALVRQWTPFAKVELAPGPAQRTAAEAVADDLVAAGLAVELREDETTMLWDKLAFLAPLSLATSARRADLGTIRREPEWRRLVVACRAEVVAVAVADGANTEEAAVAAMHDATPDEMRTIGEIELDALGGAVVRAAERHGIDVPATRELVRLIERG